MLLAWYGGAKHDNVQTATRPLLLGKLKFVLKFVELKKCLVITTQQDGLLKNATAYIAFESQWCLLSHTEVVWRRMSTKLVSTIGIVQETTYELRPLRPIMGMLVVCLVLWDGCTERRSVHGQKV